MPTNVVSVEKAVSVDPKTLPNGEYIGTWGGYQVDVYINNVLYRLITEDGIRTPAAKCVVTIRDGEVTVEV